MVFCIGISEYETKKCIPSVKKDVKQLVNLFKNYGYKYIRRVFNTIKQETIEEDNFIAFLVNQRQKIKQLISNKSKPSPDSVMFFYCGHADSRKIIVGNGNAIFFSEIKRLFDNEQLQSLEMCPKLMFWDCK